jgi:hypothetical protein
VVADGKDWIKGGYKSNYQKSVAGFKNSEGAGIIAGKNKITGNKAYLAKDKDGNIFVGKDGHIYKKKNDQWLKHENGSWSSFKKPKDQASTKIKPATHPSKQIDNAVQIPRAQPYIGQQSYIRKSSDRSSVYQSLQRSSQYRNTANNRAASFNNSVSRSAARSISRRR